MRRHTSYRCRRESIARLAKSGVGGSNRHLPRDKGTSRLHALSMRWVLMLFVVLAAVMGGEARAVVVTGRAVVSEWDGNESAVMERVAENLPGASRAVVQETRKAVGLADADPLAFWFPGRLAAPCVRIVVQAAQL